MNGYLTRCRNSLRHLFCASALMIPLAVWAQALPWMDPTLPPEQRAALLVNAMTLDQKIQQLHGASGTVPGVPECGSAIRKVPGIPALQIPTFRITNGPVGLGGGDCTPQDPATALPVAHWARRRLRSQRSRSRSVT